MQSDNIIVYRSQFERNMDIFWQDVLSNIAFWVITHPFITIGIIIASFGLVKYLSHSNKNKRRW